MDALTKRPSEFEDKLRSAHEKLRKDHVDLLYKVQKLEKENDELMQLTASNQTSSDKEHLVTELEGKVHTLEATLSSIKDSNEQLKDEVHKVQNEKTTLETNVKQMNSKAQQRQHQQEKLMEEKVDDISKLREEVKRLKASVQHVTQELNSSSMKGEGDDRDNNDSSPMQLAKKIVVPDLLTPPPSIDGNAEIFGAVPKVLFFVCCFHSFLRSFLFSTCSPLNIIDPL